ncbi:fatty acid hydroxylase superfamily protein [Nitzschia inconspicua]|uniref:Fatty acid hydroxylase superfamily protein n=1 Tax=Nitzschia inconspicua TaxID=303405 RepID=A0A9K3KZI6_9STRA|nr:fatty acid hydroxylase superfamily protein [Nitzschia inconspicua]
MFHHLLLLQQQQQQQQQSPLDDNEIWHHAMVGGLEMSTSAVVVTLILELWSLDTVRQVRKQPNGKELYVTAILYNFVNHFVLGVPTYMIAAIYFCTKEDEEKKDSFEAWTSYLLQVLFILVAHSLQYYYVHKTFHESPALYRTFHRFHHRFNTHVPPSAANAVTIGEYGLAYVLPFATAALLGRVTVPALRCAIFITIVLNAVVHTPKLEARSEQWIPFFWVSTADHLNHHRKLQVHYASPLFNVDNILLQ